MSEIMQAPAWIHQIIPWVIKAILAIVIFYAGRMIAKWLSGMLAGHLSKQGLDEMLVRLVKNTAYIALLAVVVLAALEQLGINTTSALAIFGAAGLAVGLAIKDSLSNFAAGVLIVFFKPFDIGHYIEAAGTSGSVFEVDMFNTTLVTPDNKRVMVPNRLIYNDTIVNYSAEENRRVDMVFGIGYDDDINTARQLIESIVASDERILKDPAPVVAVNELADSSVNLVVRPWVKSGDYWDVRVAMMEKIKQAFDKSGISIPYPQQDVHMHQAVTKAA
jgi:small conductance mechanosensitive channel